MFELTTSAFGKYRRYDLRHPESGNGFSIVPERGATVLEINFNGYNILDGYQSPEELEAGKWGKCALLFPFPNRLRDGAYAWLGQRYQFPLNNAATGNAIHGFVRDEAFEPVHIELSAESAEITCRYDYRGHHPFYPFPFTLDVTFTITLRNEFDVTFALKNHHTAAIPAGFGWHPYFRLDERADNHTLHLPACSMVDIDERMIPTGSLTPYTAFEKTALLADTFLDNCFKAETDHALYHISLGAGRRSLSVSASKALFPYFQVFTPPARESVALEPMSCNVDAFHNGDGLITLEAGADWIGAFRVEYSEEKG